MITVIMSTYHEPIDYISKAIDSILNQTYSDFEFIIVIDDPKRKDIVELIKKKHDSRIVPLLNDRNLGLTASLNRAIDFANGEYIARMDADDISRPDRLKRQLSYLVSNRYDLIGSDISNINSNDKIIRPHVAYPRDNNSINKILRHNNPIPHPTWFGKADIFKDNKYIDFLACEDYEFLVRISLHGKRLGNISEVLLDYRINTEGISFKKKGLQRTGLAYISKNFRKKKISKYSEYKKYINSQKGKRRIKLTQKFFEIVRKLKDNSSPTKRLLIILTNMPIMLSTVGFENIYGAIEMRSIRRKNQGNK